MEEYSDNLTSALLNENNLTRHPEFTALQRLSILLCKHFEKVNLQCISRTQDEALKIREELNKHKRDNLPTTSEITDVNEYSAPIPGPLPSNDEIKC